MCVFSVSLHDFFFTMQLKTSAEVGHLLIFSFSIGTCKECSILQTGLVCPTSCFPGCYCNNTYLSGSTANTQYRIMPYNGVCGACPKASTTAPTTTRTESSNNPTTVSTIYPIATKITTNCGPCPMFSCIYQEGILCVSVLLTTVHGMICIEKYKELYCLKEKNDLKTPPAPYCFTGCTYNSTGIVADACGCYLGCGTLVCTESTAHPIVSTTTADDVCPKGSSFNECGAGSVSVSILILILLTI